MMPDGRIVDDAIAQACAKMHDRLICWGRLFLRGGKGPRQKWDGDDEREHFDYKPQQVDDTRVVHMMVTQLPKPQQSILLQRFYVDDVIATTWHQMSQFRRDTVSGLIADDVNKAVRNLNRGIASPWVTIRAEEVDGIRLRAIRMLVNRERVVL